MTRATARCSLIGRHTDPLHQIGLEQATQGQQHQADGAVATDEGLEPLVQRLFDDVTVDRIQYDDGVFFHPQGGGGVNPVTLPASGLQTGIDILGVVAALRRDDDILLGQRLDIEGILQGTGIHAEVGGGLTGLGGGEEGGLNTGKILLFLHPAHQYRAHHATPTDQTYFFHNVLPWIAVIETVY
ncbi:hypothetical protein LMCDFJHI_00678 [Aeromonas salmonicida]